MVLLLAVGLDIRLDAMSACVRLACARYARGGLLNRYERSASKGRVHKGLVAAGGFMRGFPLPSALRERFIDARLAAKEAQEHGD
jgi:hypothetical protein